MRKAIKQFVAYATDSGFGATLSFAITVLAARSNSLEEFGTFALALAIAAVQMQAGLVGIPSIIYGRAASRPRTATALHWSGIRANIFFSGIIYIFTVIFLALFTSPLLTLFYSLAGLKVVGGFGETLRRIYQARSEPGSYVPVRIAVTSTALTVTAITFFTNGELWCYAAIWGGEFLVFSTILLFFSVRRGDCPLSRSLRVRALLVRAFPILVQGLCAAIYVRFDQVYIGWRFGAEDVALYAVAVRLTEAMALFYAIVSLVITPRIIQEWLVDGISRRSGIVLALMAAGSIAASGICFWIGGDILGLIFGMAFAAGGNILAIYFLSTCFAVYGIIGSRVNSAQGKTAPNMHSGIWGMVANIMLTIFLCEVAGPSGAAVATVLSYALSAYILWHGAILRRMRPSLGAFQPQTKRRRLHSNEKPTL